MSRQPVTPSPAVAKLLADVNAFTKRNAVKETKRRSLIATIDRLLTMNENADIRVVATFAADM